MVYPEIFHRFPQLLYINSRIILRSGHDHFLPIALQFISYPFNSRCGLVAYGVIETPTEATNHTDVKATFGNTHYHNISLDLEKEMTPKK
jgi:hypothetical protein